MITVLMWTLDPVHWKIFRSTLGAFCTWKQQESEWPLHVCATDKLPEDATCRTNVWRWHPTAAPQLKRYVCNSWPETPLQKSILKKVQDYTWMVGVPACLAALQAAQKAIVAIKKMFDENPEIWCSKRLWLKFQSANIYFLIIELNDFFGQKPPKQLEHTCSKCSWSFVFVTYSGGSVLDAVWALGFGRKERAQELTKWVETCQNFKFL